MGEVRNLKQAVRGRCPLCGKPAVEDHRPFCSARCKTIDLGRWLGGDYRIATEEDADADAGDEPEQ